MYGPYDDLPGQFADAVRVWPPAADMLSMDSESLCRLRESVEAELERQHEDCTADDFRTGRTACLHWLLNATAALINADLRSEDFIQK